MTVIAYSKGVLAADSRATDDTGQIFKTTKLYELPNGSFCGVAGDADCRDVLTLLGRGASITKLPSRASLVKTQTNCTVLWIFPGGEQIYRIQIGDGTPEKPDAGWWAEVLKIEDGYAAIGSGGAYALGAIVAGKTAVEAVRAACRLDVNCGLPLSFLKVK